jgi:hypothetical protein
MADYVGAMTLDRTSSSAAALEAQREIAVLKKHQDVAKDVGQSMVELVKQAAPAAPGRISAYA